MCFLSFLYIYNHSYIFNACVCVCVCEGGGCRLLRRVVLAVVGTARADVALHLAGVERGLHDAQDEVRPEDVQAQQEDQQAVEDVIGEEHWDYLWCIKHCILNNPHRKDPNACNNPQQRKHRKHRIAQLLIPSILRHLGRLQENIRAVMQQQHQRSNPRHITHP